MAGEKRLYRPSLDLRGWLSAARLVEQDVVVTAGVDVCLALPSQSGSCFGEAGIAGIELLSGIEELTGALRSAGQCLLNRRKQEPRGPVFRGRRLVGGCLREGTEIDRCPRPVARLEPQRRQTGGTEEIVGLERQCGLELHLGVVCLT